MMVAEGGESKELPHTIKFLDLGKRYDVRLSEENLTPVGEGVGTWLCSHVHVTTKSSTR